MKKKALSMTLVVVLALSMGITAFATPVTMSDGNVFDADYYAQNNPDVVQVLGTDVNALYSHYVNFGKTEGRMPYASDSSTTVTQTAIQGTAEAYLGAGRNALYGLNGTAISLETAYNNFLTAQQLGSVEANFYLGALYDWYSYPTKDYAIAKAYYEACGDNPNAQISLAILYMNGQGVAQDEAKALLMFQTLANKGYADAYYGLAEIAYSNGDYATALNYFTRVANEGSEQLYIGTAMNYIGYMYMHGEGVSTDYAKAMEWFIKSANLGYSEAMNDIGYMYNNGQGVSTDHAKAMEWYTKAANLGSAVAMYNIGYMYMYGEGVSTDYAKAMEWYIKSTNLGYSRAMNNIGVMYYNGMGVEKDISKAVEWWQKAAALGEEVAVENLREAGY
jgi:hypothetical protein